MKSHGKGIRHAATCSKINSIPANILPVILYVYLIQKEFSLYYAGKILFYSRDVAPYDTVFSVSLFLRFTISGSLSLGRHEGARDSGFQNPFYAQ